MSTVEITNLTRQRVPRFAYPHIVQAILPGWELSLVFVGEKRARALNEQLRNKSYIPNVLSYVLGEKHGEIFICPAEAKRQAPAHLMSERAFILYLFIHGLLHLKGMAHGATMERWEEKFMTRFMPRRVSTPAYGTTNSNGHRHRHVPGQDGRRRRSR